MKCNFTIEEVNFIFETFGSAEINIKINGKEVNDFLIPGQYFKSSNSINISLSKLDPSDEKSYATLDGFIINGKDFKDQIKTEQYIIDTSRHQVKDEKIENNLYFGYIGSLTFELQQDNSLLSKAAWTIADKEFKPVKWPLKGNNFREKNFDTIQRDARFMFAGAHGIHTPEIKNEFDNLQLKNLIEPIDIETKRTELEQWINRSARVSLENMDKFSHFSLSTGVHESLQSFVNRADRLFVTNKKFEGIGEITKGTKTKLFDLLSEEIIPGSSVLVEIPAPWYETQKLSKLIKKAKEKNCQVAIDATWIPMANEEIQIDLTNVDEFYFSMNKAWPIDSLRPAFRWSKEHIHDAQTFATTNCTYAKVGFQVFFRLLEKFPFDMTYDLYKNDTEQLCRLFDLEHTNVLWFTKRKNDPVKKKLISEHYDLEEFVSLVKLLQYKNKYFW